jgi:hypothetical protein
VPPLPPLVPAPPLPPEASALPPPTAPVQARSRPIVVDSGGMTTDVPQTLAVCIALAAAGLAG